MGIKFKKANWVLLLAVCCVGISISTSSIQQAPLSLDQWNYFLIDSTRTGNDIVKAWGSFGMDFVDANKDGYGDIVAGKWFYMNPKGDYNSKWIKSNIRDSVDNMFIVDVDGDEFADVISLKCNGQYWFEATNREHTLWRETKIGNEDICGHKMSAMGYREADIFKGGKPELLFTDKPGRILCFEIPDNPNSQWPVTVIAENGATEKFIAAGDIDNDGDLDLASAYQKQGDKNFRGVCWFENPGIKAGNWKRHIIGDVDDTADHLAIADFNGDGIYEILVSEGKWKQADPAGIYMFTAPKKNVFSNNWEKRLITAQSSTNSLEIADMDQDGDMDFVAGEHKGLCRLQIWENDGLGNFTCHLIDSLKESHNGTRLLDIEGDGDLDIASSGWYDKSVHLWINNAIE
jgi:hypothetical protein